MQKTPKHLFFFSKGYWQEWTGSIFLNLDIDGLLKDFADRKIPVAVSYYFHKRKRS